MGMCGISRSTSVTLAYLVAKRDYSLSDAFEYVRKCRSCVCPNPGFVKQLGEWEKKVRGTSTVEKFWDTKTGVSISNKRMIWPDRQPSSALDNFGRGNGR